MIRQRLRALLPADPRAGLFTTGRSALVGLAPGYQAFLNHLKNTLGMPRPSSKRRGQPRYVLRLYVAGMARASARAIERVYALCDEHLAGRYDLEVIDIYQLPALARGHQIVATPTLIRLLPQPLRRSIGDLSDEKVVFGLDLRRKP